MKDNARNIPLIELKKLRKEVGILSDKHIWGYMGDHWDETRDTQTSKIYREFGNLLMFLDEEIKLREHSGKIISITHTENNE